MSEGEPPEAEFEDNVIHLPVSVQRSASDVFSESVPPGQCRHASIRIDRTARVVKCYQCDRELDPLPLLYQLSRKDRFDEDPYQFSRAESKRRAEEALKELETVKKELAKQRKGLREARREDPVETYKALVLENVGRWVDRVVAGSSQPTRIVSAEGVRHEERRPGEYEERAAEQIDAVRAVLAQMMIQAEAWERFDRKLGAAREELDARRRRLKIQIVQGKRARR